jgi:carboxylesterase type B
MGCNSNEGWIFAMGLYEPIVLQEKYITIVEEEFGDFSSNVLELYPPVSGNNFDNLNNIIGDYLFVCPSFYVITSLNNEFTIDKKSYLYLFDHTPSWSIPAAGAFHTAEVCVQTI